MELAIYAHRMWYQTSVCDFLTDAHCATVEVCRIFTPPHSKLLQGIKPVT